MASRKTAAAGIAPPRKTRAPRAAAKEPGPAGAAPSPKVPKVPKAAKVEAPMPAKAGGKTKLIRDSFTIPKDEYLAIEALKSRAMAAGRQIRKSELLRAGLQALTSMTERSLLKALDAVPTLKTGRPKAHLSDPAAKKGVSRRKAA